MQYKDYTISYNEDSKTGVLHFNHKLVKSVSARDQEEAISKLQAFADELERTEDFAI